MRVFITDDPYSQNHTGNEWNNHALWPCKWVMCPDVGESPFVTAYKRHFRLENDATIRVHVSADERYELFLDGQRIGRGSERGDAQNWFFETYDLTLKQGEHVFVARVWSQGDKAPFAQMSVYPGFILSPQEAEFVEIIGTGVAEWQAKKLGGYEFIHPVAAWGTGDNLIIHGDQFDWDFEVGQGDGWQPVVALEEGADPSRRNDYSPTHLMKPGTLPLMLDEANPIGRVCLASDIPSTETHAIPIRSSDNIEAENQSWHQLIYHSTALTIPPHTRRRILLDLENYYCAYPEVTTSGGAGSLVRVNWQESLFNEADAKTKGNRDDVEGKYFITIWWLKDGIGDTFLPDGGQHRRFETLWWQCGRYVEVVVETADEALTLESFKIRETRYPTEMESSFEASDERLLDVIPLAVRVLQCCSHETYMDCPYYEQLMYIGDTRLQVLTNFAITRDDRLPRKALRMFDASRLNYGLTQSRYPSRVTQITRSFSLWWVATVHDYALWRGDREFVQERMLGVRNVLDGFQRLINADGLVTFPHGPNFNFTDWVPGWKGGFPPDNDTGVTALVNWQWVLVLRQAAELEEWLGETEMASRWRKLADQSAQITHAAFWDGGRGIYADDLAHQHYSEHAQCLALLQTAHGGTLEEGVRDRLISGLLEAPDLARTTIYFTHYLFETFRLVGRMDRFAERMGLWFGLKEQGLKTTVEMPEPTRSDCHAWGAHPLYHYFASVLGIRPGAMGFETVHIAPQLGHLTHAKGNMVHPQGNIEVDVRLEDGKLTGQIILPPGLEGLLTHESKTTPLTSGTQAI